MNWTKHWMWYTLALAGGVLFFWLWRSGWIAFQLEDIKLSLAKNPGNTTGPGAAGCNAGSDVPATAGTDTTGLIGPPAPCGGPC